MKKRVILHLTALGAAVLLAAPTARAEISFSAGIHIGSVADFHAPLASLGAWVNVGSYGQCWHPNDVAADWRPYSDGSWQWTDAGWYWQSDEAFAAECYHYGSWVDDANYGWVWIPGTDWAPAWVTWRYNDSYIGWAPCGPNEAAPPPAEFCFVGAHDFGGPIHRDMVRVNDRSIFDRTTLVRSFQRESHDFNGVRQNIFVNRGPDINRIQRATGRTFEARPVAQVVQNSRRSETGARQPEPRAQAQPQRRVINEPAGAQTPEQRNQANQANRVRQENTAERVNRPDAASRTTQEPAGAQRETRQTSPTTSSSATRANERTVQERPSAATRENTRAAQAAPRATERSASPTIREPAGAQRGTTQPTERETARPTERQTARPAERETARPAERPSSVESRPAARPSEPATRAASPAPERKAPPEEKKQPQTQ